MKKASLTLVAVMAALVLIAFTDRSTIPAPDGNVEDYQYAVYEGTGDQRDPANYVFLSYIPAACPGAIRLYWFRLFDCDNDNDIDVDGFYCVFDMLDTDSDGSLNDAAEIPGILEKKF